MRMAALPDIADVCCVDIPVLSFSSMRMSPGFILDFSSSSSPDMNSMRVGTFFMLRVPLVVCITSSSSSFSSSSIYMVSVVSSAMGKVSVLFSRSYPIYVNTALWLPSGTPIIVMFPSPSVTPDRPVPSIFTVTPTSGSPLSSSFTVAFSVFWAYMHSADMAVAISTIILFVILIYAFLLVLCPLSAAVAGNAGTRHFRCRRTIRLSCHKHQCSGFISLPCLCACACVQVRPLAVAIWRMKSRK